MFNVSLFSLVMLFPNNSGELTNERTLTYDLTLEECKTLVIAINKDRDADNKIPLLCAEQPQSKFKFMQL